MIEPRRRSAPCAVPLLLLLTALGVDAFTPPLALSYTETSYLVTRAVHTPVGPNTPFEMVTTVSPGDAVLVTVDRNPHAQGWDYIRFTANQSLVASDPVAAYYAAGYAEGFATVDSIYSSYVTSMNPWIRGPSASMVDMLESTACGPAFIDAHLTFMRVLATNSSDTYSRQLAALLAQVDGICAGYAAGWHAGNWSGLADPPKLLNHRHIFFINFQNEMGDVINKCAAEQVNTSNTLGESWSGNLRQLIRESYRVSEANNDRCSALVKVTPDDLFIGHATWNGFNSMVRQYKTYVFQVTVTMSGYPGSIASGDDWYLIAPSNLTVTETTNDVYSEWLTNYVTPRSVSEFFRAMIACYLATSAREWALIFSEYNSGTYNNQYMILDHNLARQAYAANNATPTQPPTLLPNTFWVLEQTPGETKHHDMTWFLNTHSYWPSYNIPYFPSIYERSGYGPVAQRVGSIKNYTTYARAELFRRLHGNVTDVESMFAVLRYNNYRQDAESLIEWCVNGSYACTVNRSSVLSIAARGDLAPFDWYNEGPADVHMYVDQQLLGAVDAKFTSMRTLLRDGPVAGFAICGPTTSHGLPPLNLTALVASNGTYYQGLNLTWRGVPSYFNFALVAFEGGTGSGFAPTVTPLPPEQMLPDHTAVAAGVACGLAVLGGVLILFSRRYCFTRGAAAERYHALNDPDLSLATVT